MPKNATRPAANTLRAIARAERAIAANPADLDARVQLALCCQIAGTTCERARPAKAAEWYRRSIAEWKRVAELEPPERQPGDITGAESAATVYAMLLRCEADAEVRARVAAEAVEYLEPVVARDPGFVEWDGLIDAYQALATHHEATAPDLARQSLRKIVDLCRRDVDADYPEADPQIVYGALTDAAINLALFESRHDPPAAYAPAREAVSAAECAAARHRGTWDAERELAHVYHLAGRAVLATVPLRSRDWLLKAVAIYDRLVDLAVDEEEIRGLFADLAQVYHALFRLDQDTDTPESKAAATMWAVRWEMAQGFAGLLPPGTVPVWKQFADALEQAEEP